MGSELVSQTSLEASDTVKGGVTKSNSPFLFTDIFETYCPILMSMGMSYDEFWNGDVEIVKYYMEANKIRKRQENERLWLQGMYVYDAICCVSPLFGWQPKEPLPYPTIPYAIDDDTQKEYNRIVEEKREKTNKENFLKFMNTFNSQRKENDVDGN